MEPTRTLADGVAHALADARERSLSYVADLTDEQLEMPLLDIVNPLRWELGHIAYFAEFWTARHLDGRPPLIANADALYDSARIAHDDRWALPLPSRRDTLTFMQRQLDALLRRIGDAPADARSEYFYRLALYHEDMHGEALLMTRQTVGYPLPALGSKAAKPPSEARRLGDAQIPGGSYLIGAQPEDGFVFDNEQWAHEVEIAPFAIARTAVCNAEYLAFVEAGGYRDERLWSRAGWEWRCAAQAEHPLHWRPAADGWHRRHFERTLPLVPGEPVLHVNWFEANAFCTWAGRRLPSEAEWEVAATGERRRFPWGEAPARPSLANLDGWYGNVVDVAAFARGESPFGCRQMIGNAWEWTATPFGPYPGFAPGPYKEYSEPWFGTHYVLRGGAWSTRARLVTTRWRNFYRPQRRDIIAGLRTCAV